MTEVTGIRSEDKQRRGSCQQKNGHGLRQPAIQAPRLRCREEVGQQTSATDTLETANKLAVKCGGRLNLRHGTRGSFQLLSYVRDFFPITQTARTALKMRLQALGFFDRQRASGEQDNLL